MFEAEVPYCLDFVFFDLALSDSDAFHQIQSGQASRRACRGRCFILLFWSLCLAKNTFIEYLSDSFK